MAIPLPRVIDGDHRILQSGKGANWARESQLLAVRIGLKQFKIGLRIGSISDMSC
jgi:hypothetical protein